MAENANENAYIARTPPYNNEAEQMVLSGMFFDEEGTRLGVEALLPEDFYVKAHQLIFTAMLDLYGNQINVDIVTVKNRLEELGVFEQIGGMAYLAQLAGYASTTAGLNDYLKIVSDKAVLRRLINAAKKVEEECYGAVEDVDGVVSSAEVKIREIAEKRNAKDFHSVVDVVLKCVDKIEKSSKSDSNITGIETGFTDFDKKTAGLQNTDLILIAARPSMGKTAFALNIAEYAATRGNIPVAIFSLEMSADQLMNRMLSAEAMIDAQKLKLGDLQHDEWGNLAVACSLISDSKIYIDDTPAITPMQLLTKCRKLKLEHGLGLVVIDYLQLMDGSNGRRSDSQQQEVAFVSKSLKAIAKELEVPVIALSQLSRACEGRQDKRPMMSDLRDSGAIEQDADMVCFLYRDEYYNPDTEKKGVAELIISKHRNGSTGTVELAWLGNYTKFANSVKPLEGDNSAPFDI